MKGCAALSLVLLLFCMTSLSCSSRHVAEKPDKNKPSPGSLDAAFGSIGSISAPIGSADDAAYAAAIQADGKIVIAGVSTSLTTSGTGTTATTVTTNQFLIARFQSSGALDPTFGLQQNGSASNFTGTARAVGVQPDGKIVAAGNTGESDGSNADIVVARYTPDGVLDSSFNSKGTTTVNFGYVRNDAYSLVVQPDGKIIVVGEVITGGTFTSVIARFSKEGPLDTSFNSTGTMIIETPGISSRAKVVKMQADGKIVVGGDFQAAGGAQIMYLARLESDGAADQSFGTGMVTVSTGTTCAISDIEVLPDGKILVAGTTTTSGTFDISLTRLNADGSTDTTFGTGGTAITDDIIHGSEIAAGLSVQADGKIIVAATFHPSNTASANDFAVFRHNPDGTLDTTFGKGLGMVTRDFGGGSNDLVFDVLIQQDGKIVMAGATVGKTASDSDIGLARYWP